ncbi:MAG: class I SAM-dependent methyltransferase [Candidatus Aminicenantes bacterium]
MIKIIQKILYSFGMNLSVYDVKSELKLLKRNLPHSFKERHVVDIGCGNGKISKKLKKVLKPKTFEGVDISSSLVHAAKRRGLKARVLDVATQNISGDLGILWGVVHHFNDPVLTLNRLRKNFRSLLIRAPVDHNRICELGHKFSKEKFIKILSDANIKINQCMLVESKKTKALILFCDFR